MRGFKSTVVLVAIFLGLAAYIYFVESRQPSEAIDSRPKAFDVEADTIQEIRVTSDSGETSVLQKQGDAWQLVEPVAAAADESEISSLTTSLSSLEIQRVVEENATDLAPFGLAEPRIDVAFRTDDSAEARHLFIGEKTATGGDLYAKLDGENRVFLIASYLENTFNREPFDLRDKSILKFERANVDRLEVDAGSHEVALTQQDNAWSLTEPWKARADFNAVDGVIGRLNTSQMRTIVADEPQELKTYGLDRPRLTATVGAGSTRATLLVGQETEEGTVYARDASRPMVFTIDSSLVDELTKAPVEYRRTDIFDFRAFNATRFEMTRDGKRLLFEKSKGSDENAEERWRQVEPAAQEIDGTKMTDLLSLFSNLRAETWVDSRDDTGLDAPVATVVVHYDEGQEERVVFGRSGDAAFAALGGEPGAARIQASSFDEALKALDGLTPTT